MQKNYIDQLDAYHSEEKVLKVNSFTRSANSLHFYDSMLVIEKKPVPKRYTKQTGLVSLSGAQEPEPTGLQFLKIKLKYMYRHKMNELLNLLGLPFKNGDKI